MIKMTSMAAILPLAQQSSPAPAGPTSGGPLMLLFWVFFIGAMWFLLIAPQRKKQKEQQKMISALASGDQVLLTGGIYGEITSVRPDRLIVRIGDNTKVEVDKAFIHAVVKKSGTS
jgi:preprotein translocase subunit YajC